LMEALPGYWNALVADLSAGTFRPPRALPPRLRAALAPYARPRRRRAEELRSIGPRDLVGIWPGLRLVSCWGDGHAALHRPALRRRRPGVRLQPKGLLATEACVSIPFADRAPVAARSHFFEFLEGDSPRLAHELEEGGVYSVVVTTGGGFYRYCLEDR